MLAPSCLIPIYLYPEVRNGQAYRQPGQVRKEAAVTSIVWVGFGPPPTISEFIWFYTAKVMLTRWSIGY